MAKLQEKIQNGLMEGRIFVLATQVMLGIQLKVHFEERYDTLPEATRWVKAGGLLLMAIAFTLVILPSMFHRIAERGHDTPRVNEFIGRTLRWAPVPFGLAIATDFFVTGERLYSRGAGIALAVGALVLGLGMLELFPAVARRRRRAEIDRKVRMSEQEKEPTPVGTKINHVLTEARLVLPGAQALLGFQFVVMLTNAFERLPQSSKDLHLVSFCLVALATVLLMTPAVYHRIVERGEETEHFHTLASRFTVLATVPIGLAIALDTFVILRRATGSLTFAATVAVALWVLMASLWYGLTLFARRSHHRHAAAGHLEREPA